MSKKMGPNDPCWCGSGKKFKKCHWQREHQDRPKHYETAKSIKKSYSVKECLAPSSFKAQCSGTIIRAHTVPKSESLKKIARSGHVYHYKKDLMSLYSNSGHLQVDFVGINSASTFTGFCSHHDTKLFSPIENTTFSDTPEQCFLIVYRAVARELFTKKAAADSLSSMHNLDKGRTLEEQIAIQRFIQSFSSGTHTGLHCISTHKHLLDSVLVSQDFSSIHAYVIDLENPPDIMCSGALFVETDFEGNEFDNLAKADERLPDLLAFSSFASGTNGKIAFVWSDVSVNGFCDSFIKSLDRIPDVDLPHAIMRFIFEHIENCYFRPDWWESLSEPDKERLMARIETSADPFTKRSPKCLCDDGVRIVQWKVIGRSEVNYCISC